MQRVGLPVSWPIYGPEQFSGLPRFATLPIAELNSLHSVAMELCPLLHGPWFRRLLMPPMLLALLLILFRNYP